MFEKATRALRLNLKRYDELYEVFNELDSVSKDDLRDFDNKLIFNVKNADGFIEFDEWLADTEEIYGELSDDEVEQMKHAFRAVDDDGDDLISYDELETYFNSWTDGDIIRDLFQMFDIVCIIILLR